MPTWSQRLETAVKADAHWAALPAFARLDRVFKESGVRDLVVAVCDHETEVERLRAVLRERLVIQGWGEASIAHVCNPKARVTPEVEHA